MREMDTRFILTSGRSETVSLYDLTIYGDLPKVRFLWSRAFTGIMQYDAFTAVPALVKPGIGAVMQSGGANASTPLSLIENE
jgi:hypothetical protein